MMTVELMWLLVHPAFIIEVCVISWKTLFFFKSFFFSGGMNGRKQQAHSFSKCILCVYACSLKERTLIA